MILFHTITNETNRTLFEDNLRNAVINFLRLPNKRDNTKNCYKMTKVIISRGLREPVESRKAI